MSAYKKYVGEYIRSSVAGETYRAYMPKPPSPIPRYRVQLPRYRVQSLRL